MAAGGPQMLASNVWGVDAAVRHVLWYGVTCHPADAGEQCLGCGCSSPSCTVVLYAADSNISKEKQLRFSSCVMPYCRQRYPREKMV